MVPHRRVDHARGDAVDVDLVLDQVEPGALGEADHRGLRRAVDRDQRLATAAGFASEVDDLPTTALGHHLAGRGLEGEQEALGVDGELLVVARLGDLEDRRHLEDAGIVHKDVDAAGLLSETLAMAASIEALLGQAC